MSGHATKRINEIYEELKRKYGRSLSTDTTALEILAIKHYLDERSDADEFSADLPQSQWSDRRYQLEANRQRQQSMSRGGMAAAIGHDPFLGLPESQD